MGAFLPELQGGMSMDRPDEKIKQHIPQDELLAQLAEECAELSQAALKPAFAAWLIMITGLIK